MPVITNPASAISVTQLLSVTAAAYDPVFPATRIQTISDTLWYSVFATNDGVAKLGGQSFGNEGRVYSGSLDDAALNRAVARVAADATALNELQAHYQTAGTPQVPLITIHTTGDEIVPYWHEALYRDKVIANRRSLWHENIQVERYGHCNFQTAEVLSALLKLQAMVANPPKYTTMLPLIAR